MTDLDTRETADVRAERVNALEEERHRLRERLAVIRAELAELRASGEARKIKPPELWSQAEVDIDDVEAVLRQEPDTEWTIAKLGEHFPDASVGQLRRQIRRLVKRGIIRNPSHGRYVLAKMTAREYRRARGPRKMLRDRVLETFLANEVRAWTKRTLADHLGLVTSNQREHLGKVLGQLVDELYLTCDNNGWYLSLPAEVRNAVRQRGDTEVITRVTTTRTRPARRAARGR